MHIYATDASALSLGVQLPDAFRVTAIVVPENRVATDKVQALTAQADVPVLVQARGQSIAEGAPPAAAAVSWLYSQVFPADLLARYPRGILNMHGGRIPEYRGANVLQWAIVNGETTLTVTWHQVVQDLDAGPIWAEEEIPIPPDATAAEVRAEMISCGQRLFPNAWPAMMSDGTPVRIPNLSNGRIWPQRRPKDGLIGAGLTKRQLADVVRALCPPWPPATITVAGEVRRVRALVAYQSDNTLPYVTADGERVHIELEP